MCASLRLAPACTPVSYLPKGPITACGFAFELFSVFGMGTPPFPARLWVEHYRRWFSRVEKIAEIDYERLFLLGLFNGPTWLNTTMSTVTATAA